MVGVSLGVYVYHHIIDCEDIMQASLADGPGVVIWCFFGWVDTQVMPDGQLAL
jgi:hypothetical protein